jgi:MYXO-CTERM domain-containing protein
MKRLLLTAVLAAASASWAELLPPDSAEPAPAAVRVASKKKTKKRKGLSCAAVPGAPLALGLVLVAGLARRRKRSA